jgi:hypothetical protein
MFCSNIQLPVSMNRKLNGIHGRLSYAAAAALHKAWI